MARKRYADQPSGRLTRTLSTPGAYLLHMVLFLTIVGFIAAILAPQFIVSFQTNPFINGLIVTVTIVGILFAFAQVYRLYREIRWVNAFRVADPGLAIDHQPKLLAPMATMLRDRKGQVSLSTQAMRSLMDSIGSRLDEARDTGRYLVGLLVFLGLLGTFWGLLETIQSVGKTINALDTRGGDSVLVFEELKSGLAAPLRGMGTAFASSLFGLSGSLVLGFLELQASQAQNRFYNELEEWLSGITELSPGQPAEDTRELNRQIYVAMFEMQRALSEISDRLQQAPAAGANGSDAAVRDLSNGVGQLVAQMRREQEIVRQWVDEQASHQGEVVAALRQIVDDARRRGQS